MSQEDWKRMSGEISSIGDFQARLNEMIEGARRNGLQAQALCDAMNKAMDDVMLKAKPDGRA